MASLPIPASPKPWGGPQDTAKNPWDYMENWKKKTPTLLYNIIRLLNSFLDKIVMMREKLRIYSHIKINIHNYILYDLN